MRWSMSRLLARQNVSPVKRKGLKRMDDADVEKKDCKVRLVMRLSMPRTRASLDCDVVREGAVKGRNSGEWEEFGIGFARI